MDDAEKEKYVQCKCGAIMEGVRKGEIRAGADPKNVRTKCEDCGGNRTRYNKKNPAPYGKEWRKQRKAKAKGDARQ